MLNKVNLVKEYIRLTNLARQLNYEYHVQNSPTVTDEVYDNIFEQIRYLERQLGKDLPSIETVTKQVGGIDKETFKTKPHLVPMLSIQTVFNGSSVKAFIDASLTEHEYVSNFYPSLIGELKYDGLAVSLVYVSGKLSYAVTRGDGLEGEIITQQIKTIGNIPLYLPDYFHTDETVEVRGEVLFLTKDFQKLNERLIQEGKKPFVNARNAASGSVRNTDIIEVSKRPLVFMAYRFICSAKRFDTQEQTLKHLLELGFKTSEHYIVTDNLDAIFDFFFELENRGRDNLPFEIDGVVIKFNDLKRQQEMDLKHKEQDVNADILGVSRTVPWAIALKFKPCSAVTQLLRVDFNVGKTGLVTPVAIVKEVIANGVCIEYVNLYNIGEIQRLGLKIGDLVEIERRGDVIPKISKVISSGDKAIELPTYCPCCGQRLLEMRGILRCTNMQNCTAQHLHRLSFFTSMLGMKIEGLNLKTLEKLWDANLVRKYSDLYFLTADTIISAKIPGIGKRTATAIIEQISLSKRRLLHEFLSSIAIPNVGYSTAINICRVFPNIEEISTLTVEQLLAEKIPNVGVVTANSIVKFFRNDSNIDCIIRLLENGIIFRNTVYGFGLNKATKKIVITGSFPRPRDYMAAILNQVGYEVTNTVTKETYAVLVGHKPGNTLQKAKELNIDIHNFNYGKPDNNKIFSLIFKN